MDRKEQMKIWKEKEREKKLREDVLSTNFRTSTYAKIQLGEPTFQITKDDILNTEHLFQLFEKIDLKISELVYKIKPSKIDIAGIDDEIVKTLPFPLKAIFFTNEFETIISIGDADKEFFYENNLEKSEKESYFDELISYYSEMKNTKMISLIEEGKKAKKEKDFDKISEKFEQLEIHNDEIKMNYIKQNIEQFELK